MGQEFLRIDDVSVHFPIRKGVLQRQTGTVKAVEKVSLSLNKGEAFGLVGESGCGKTTLARTVLRLISPTTGAIWFDGQNITELNGKGLAPYRRRVAAVFQDPFSSLNPRMKAGAIIAEVLYVHKYDGDRAARVLELLSLCGLSARFAELYPHQMSGGQRQRVGIARALALEPDLIVCDEAVSALDVSIQAQIINLLEELRARLNLTYLFIGHDLSGRVMETARSDVLFDTPQHPYTRALINAVPNPDPLAEASRDHAPLKGEVPSPLDPPSGCVFHPRCPVAMETCRTAEPSFEALRPGHSAACHAITQHTQTENQTATGEYHD